MNSPLVHLSRRYTFSASHRLYTAHLGFAENQAMYGKCANPNGHGHNYGVTITIRGAVSKLTGFVMPLEEIDQIVKRNVLDPYDHRYLNLDVEDFFNLVPTGENMVKRIWERLEKALNGRLAKVVLDETRNNRFEYTGDTKERGHR